MVLGVTGSLGTGKSTVANFFRELGASVLDADKITHELLIAPGGCRSKVIRAFGRKILDEKGGIDRKKLAGVVFGTRKGEELKKLCQIIHPEVIKQIRSSIREIKKWNPSRVIIVDAPLLLESGAEKIVDKILVVKCPGAEQLRRVGDRMTGREASRRIKSQIPLEEKIRRAHFVIDNGGSLARTGEQVEEIWKSVTKTTKA